MTDKDLIEMAIEDLEDVQDDIEDIFYVPVNKVRKETKRINEIIDEAIRMIKQGTKES